MRQGQPEPWWDARHQVVRAQPFFRYVIHDALARIRARSGTVSEYLLGNGLTVRDLGSLRTSLVS